jgi:hypothetical protein
VSPMVRWGVAIGVLIAVIDAISLVAVRALTPESEVGQIVALANQIANVLLYSVAGLRVGRETGVVRSAAEAGVLAGVIAGIAAVLGAYVLNDPTVAPASTQEMIGTLALNVAMGGVLGLLNGWLARRAELSGKRR